MNKSNVVIIEYSLLLVVNIVIILPVNQNLQGDIDLEEAWSFASVA